MRVVIQDIIYRERERERELFHVHVQNGLAYTKCTAKKCSAEWMNVPSG